MGENEKQANLTPEEVSRYARHLSLPEIGLKGQEQLKNSSVITIGTGGLGSPLLIYLAAAGIGRIGIVDFDLVEDSNLQRQIIHTTNSIGTEKTDSAKKHLLKINPYCQIDLFNEKLTKDNALNILNGYDIICDCSDNFPTRYLINDASTILSKPCVYGSIAGFEGQASVFNLTKESPNYRDLIPIPPPLELIPSCSEAGVMGILPGIIGTIQATETIKIITKIGNPLDGRLLTFNALKMSFKELTLRPNIENKKIHQLIDYDKYCSNTLPSNAKNKINFKIKSISTKDLKSLLNKQPDKISVIDVRHLAEHLKSSIPGSKLIPLHEIENGEALEKIQEIKNDYDIYFYCKTGNRSIRAIKYLEKFGINSINIEGGIEAWDQGK